MAIIYFLLNYSAEAWPQYGLGFFINSSLLGLLSFYYLTLSALN